ncbi:MAG: hypothetical protein P4L62_02645 [Candidatus Pacebacteria bacterium]|nr:hypothetical protein [Candidatus Paceibacterota bacterium]MDR3583232.1 hypothetical protein [Candidatus Paceibacterota bacterium]
MGKKITIAILGTIIIIAIGVATYFAANKPVIKPASLPVPAVKSIDKTEQANKPIGQTGKITYLVSNQDKTKFCNGVAMDSEGYRKTITAKVTSDVPKDGLTDVELAKKTAVLATDGMCQEVLKQTNFKVVSGVVEISPIEGWAGISIVMCSCQPEVEVNLLQIPGIKKVVWQSN